MSGYRNIRRGPSGEYVKARREALGMTIEGLAALLGVSPATLYRWEAGYYLIPKRNWIALEAVFERLMTQRVKEARDAEARLIARALP